MSLPAAGRELLVDSAVRPDPAVGEMARQERAGGAGKLVPENKAETEPEWLDEAQARIWITFMQVQLRLSYEMNRQLLSDSQLQLGDYHVLSALSAAPDGRLQISALATYVGWERSRMSHHVQRMASRGLVQRAASRSDRRATDIQLTALGWDTITSAAPRHVDLVRRLFFAGLPQDRQADFQKALDGIYQTLLAQGTLAAPAAVGPQAPGDLQPHRGKLAGGAPRPGWSVYRSHRSCS
jgi:DNA-binding MarR family transcriptional regulator